jgi:hypothetical protein
VLDHRAVSRCRLPWQLKDSQGGLYLFKDREASKLCVALVQNQPDPLSPPHLVRLGMCGYHLRLALRFLLVLLVIIHQYRYLDREQEQGHQIPV